MSGLLSDLAVVGIIVGVIGLVFVDYRRRALFNLIVRHRDEIVEFAVVFVSDQDQKTRLWTALDRQAVEMRAFGKTWFPHFRRVTPIGFSAGSAGGVGHILSPNTLPCQICGALPSTFHVENYDPMWRDGDVMCPNGHRVRGYDAG